MRDEIIALDTGGREYLHGEEAAVVHGAIHVRGSGAVEHEPEDAAEQSERFGGRIDAWMVAQFRRPFLGSRAKKITGPLGAGLDGTCERLEPEQRNFIHAATVVGHPRHGRLERSAIV